MSKGFDPYYKWLGIPPKDQPPDLYRLLGVERFESDADVIDAAASKQMAYVRSCATGPRMDLSQKILNELAAARVCLLNSEKKAAYDVALRAELAPPNPPEVDVLPEMPQSRLPVAVPISDAPAPVVPGAPSSPSSAHGPVATGPHRQKAAVYAIVAVAVAVCVLLVAMLSGPGEKEVAARNAMQEEAEEDVGDEPASALEIKESETEKTVAEEAAREVEAEKRAAEEAAREAERMDAEQPERTDVQETVRKAIGEEAQTEHSVAEDARKQEEADILQPDSGTLPFGGAEGARTQDEHAGLPDDWHQQLDGGMAAAETPAAFKPLTEQAFHFADLAILADNAHAAEHCLRTAVAASRKANDIPLMQQAALRYARLQDEGLSDRLKEEASKNLGRDRLRTSALTDGTPPLAVAPFDAEEAGQHQQARADYLEMSLEWERGRGAPTGLIATPKQGDRR